LYALEPVVVWFVDLIGPVSTFALGGFLLIVTGYFFRKSTKNLVLTREYEESKAKKSNFPLVLSLGLVIGLATGIMMNVFPDLLAQKLEEYSHTDLGGSHFVSFILGASALLAYPIAQATRSISLSNNVLYSSIFTFASIILVFTAPEKFTTILSCIALAIGYSWLSVSAFPMALKNLSPKTVTLGAGIFYGCTEFADNLLNIFQNL
jgi:hypothetical protein